jgi:hypothetical protein
MRVEGDWRDVCSGEERRQLVSSAARESLAGVFQRRLAGAFPDSDQEML